MSQIRLTNSEMKDWRRCKRKWWLGNYRGLQKYEADFYNPLSIGTRIHEVLGEYYVPGYERPDPMEYFEWTVQRDLALYPYKEEALNKEADLCRKMLEGYFQWLEEEGFDADLSVIEPESEMEVPLVIGPSGEVRATILSKIDARVEDKEGKRQALEHKTVQSLTDPIRRLQVDTQLLTEHLVEYMHHLAEDPSKVDDNRATGVIYNMLRKVKRTANAKPPFYGRHEITHSAQELRSHWKHAHAQAEEILKVRYELDHGADPHTVAYPNPTGDCTWDCPFREPCLGGMFDDGSDVEGYLSAEYEVGDPLERYRSSQGLIKPENPEEQG